MNISSLTIFVSRSIYNSPTRIFCVSVDLILILYYIFIYIYYHGLLLIVFRVTRNVSVCVCMGFGIFSSLFFYKNSQQH